ncbi:ATP-dependent DNA ligase [Streptomyces sp. NPDC058762]|uniref:ATP-dependent DNA ligase n=1 Tax=Streptomyces sp. NPDC058762 TaxID=3346629 RepID=UPI0036A5E8DD
MTWTLPDPMLTAAAPGPDLPPRCAAEPKWDGFRALMSWDASGLVLRSRQGTDLLPAFPEVRVGAAQMPDATALDGEIVVWEGGRLAFERLQQRLQRRGAGAASLAAQLPCHFVAFDLLRLSGTDTTGWSYQWRRDALEGLFSEHRLTAPWALCPSTTDPDTVREWLSTWTAVGLEGLVFKRLDSVYQPSARGGWRKYKVRVTEDAVVGAYAGPAAAPRTLLLGRYDAQGRLRYVGRSTTLPQASGRAVASLLIPAGDEHPWTGWSFSAGWGSREGLHVTLVDPELVVEVGVDVARDRAGRWRHPARWHRSSPDLLVADVPDFESGTSP